MDLEAQAKLCQYEYKHGPYCHKEKRLGDTCPLPAEEGKDYCFFHSKEGHKDRDRLIAWRDYARPHAKPDLIDSDENPAYPAFEAWLVNADLSNARLDSSKLNHANLTGCKLVGTFLHKCELPYVDYNCFAFFAWPAKRTHFETVDTSGVNWSHNPAMKRDIEDYQWIKQWKQKSPVNKGIHFIWYLACNFGRSTALWLSWGALFVVAFWGLYQYNSCQFDRPDLLYLSVVTFTGLGPGDVVPLSDWAQFLVSAESVIGYIMLGGLIALFASKMIKPS